jgi:hypothetical protein
MRPNARYEAARARRIEEEEAEAPVPEKERIPSNTHSFINIKLK